VYLQVSPDFTQTSELWIYQLPHQWPVLCKQLC